MRILSSSAQGGDRQHGVQTPPAPFGTNTNPHACTTGSEQDSNKAGERRGRGEKEREKERERESKTSLPLKSNVACHTLEAIGGVFGEHAPAFLYDPPGKLKFRTEQSNS